MKNRVIRVISVVFAWIIMLCCTFTACSSKGEANSEAGSSSENSSEEGPSIEDAYSLTRIGLTTETNKPTFWRNRATGR